MLASAKDGSVLVSGRTVPKTDHLCSERILTKLIKLLKYYGVPSVISDLKMRRMQLREQ